MLFEVTSMRAFRLLLAGLLLLGVPVAAHAKLRVVTTLSNFASLASVVGGDRVETFSLAKGYQDPHFVDAKPSFVLQLSRADLLIVAGLELEIGYLQPLLDQSRNARIQRGNTGYLDASVGCEILERPTTAITRTLGDVHPFGNPHYWTDPENGRRAARAIAEKLAQLDPAGKGTYDRNLEEFEAKLTGKEAEWAAAMAPYVGTEVVAFHNSWPNFAKHFQLAIAGFIEPKPGIPPTPSHTLAIINLIKERKIRLILVEPYFDLKTPKFISAQTGAKVVVLYPSVGGRPEITDYFSLFDHDVAVLVGALEGNG
jgi:zinc/manganese transport system substrate-binding protein